MPARELFHFGEASQADAWYAIDDVVMGGESRSRLRADAAGHAVFEGRVSLARGGGFASVRSRARDVSAPGAVAYVLDVLGDGRRYKLSVRTDDAFDGIAWQAAFDPPAGQWTRLALPVAGFAATFRGRPVAGAPPLDPARARQFGIVIADRNPGAFALAIRAIRAE